MLLEAQERRGDKASSKGPPMATWSAEVDMLAQVKDAVEGVKYILTAVNSKKQPKPPEPTQRPTSAITKIKREMRQAKHESLVARVLPHKAKTQS